MTANMVTRHAMVHRMDRTMVMHDPMMRVVPMVAVVTGGCRGCAAGDRDQRDCDEGLGAATDDVHGISFVVIGSARTCQRPSGRLGAPMRNDRVGPRRKNSRHGRDLAKGRYTSGLGAYIDVHNVEHQVRQADFDLAQSQVIAPTDLVALFKALGGGWEEGAAHP